MKKIFIIFLFLSFFNISFAVSEADLETNLSQYSDIKPETKEEIEFIKSQRENKDTLKKVILDKNETENKSENISKELKEKLKQEVKKELMEEQKKKALQEKKVKLLKILEYKKKRKKYLSEMLKRKSALLNLFKRKKEYGLLETIGKNIVRNNDGKLDILYKKISFLEEQIDLGFIKLNKKNKWRIKVLFKVIGKEIYRKKLKKQNKELQGIIKQKDEFDDLLKIVNKQNATYNKTIKNNNNQENTSNNEDKQEKNNDGDLEKDVDNFDLDNLLK